MPSSIPTKIPKSVMSELHVDDGADGVFLFDDVPGVGLKLPHTQADALVLDVDAEDLCFDETSHLDQL